ncbi:Neoverrucotoxin subunit alpha [Triplophysa tibetana]|uniref:Neoverrucotoxin subunit alpha n=1 Tax=Triplophysa tibetana TaxID=1572043 RepID=A0A5A9NWE1_9TELE|nr:Neoverrucotoxin subunit alpha [Triplophysa tibetana]
MKWKARAPASSNAPEGGATAALQEIIFVEEMASNQMTVAALGRPFTLGMLYDARRDELHTGFTLWDKKTLQENRSEHAQRSSSFEITTSDSVESKSSLLDVDASLKASFLSGLIQVEGSAKYLNDQKKSKNQSRVTLQYKATTTFEQLSMTHHEAKNMLSTDNMDKESATHVVTGILYGAHAFFVFDSQKLDSSSAQYIQGSMQAVIKKIPTFDVEGKVSIKLTDEEKALTDQFSCKFYGDFILQSNPATFEDAVKTYTQLPNLLEQKQTAVPLKVWLTPLKKFDCTVVELKGEICIGLVRKAEKAVENVWKAEIRCSDSLGEKELGNVPRIHKKLRNFHKLCQDYTSMLRLTMEKKFPLIRTGEEDVVSLEKLFDDREKSPFSEDNLNNWMTDREREITAIRSCVEIMKETKPKMVRNQSDLDREILAPGIDHALCFVFTSIEHNDPYLENMTKYLHSHELQSDENVTLPTEDQWYISERVHIREKAKAFRDFTGTLKNNSRFTFLIAVIPNENHKGATIYHYKDGILITDDFSQPNIPEEITDRRDLIWCKYLPSTNSATYALGYRHLGYDAVLYGQDIGYGKSVEEMASNQMMVAALGRPFTLGMLYDARKDEVLTGFMLWDKKTLQENRSEHAQRSSSFEITASDSIESKSSLLDVDASLKASFLSGLIQVEGSAKYLNDQKKSKNQSRVTLQYKATTTFEQLSMTHHEAKNMLNTAIMDKESATHVVTGILYGAHAFFVFDSQKLDSSSAQDIQGSMQAVIKKIPTFDVEGKVSIKLTDEEKALTDQFSCKFYGDFILQSNPATFEDAVKTYTQLPNLLEQKQKAGVPLKVWLTPLKKFDSTVVELKGEICIGLVRKAEKAVEDVVQAEMRCSDSLGENMVEKLPQIHKKLRNFHKLCQDYKSKLQISMEKKFPLIRAGEEDDVSLEKLFDDREKSPFSYDNLNNWMNVRETEITAIRSCVEIMKETKPKMVTNLSELNSKILAPGVDHALCFVFTSVERDDPYLENMTKYLYSHGSHSDENVTTEDQWYISEGVHIREKAKAFRDFTSTLRNSSSFTFLIAVIPNKKYKGATIYHYKDGILMTDDFSQPRIPEVMTDRRDLIWYACDLNLDSITASNWLTLSEDNKTATCVERTSSSYWMQESWGVPGLACWHFELLQRHLKQSRTPLHLQ